MFLPPGDGAVCRQTHNAISTEGEITSHRTYSKLQDLEQGPLSPESRVPFDDELSSSRVFATYVQCIAVRASGRRAPSSAMRGLALRAQGGKETRREEVRCGLAILGPSWGQS
jgi:hypothetical protein